MKKLITFGLLPILAASCSLNDDYKKVPGAHGPPYHLHSYIWNNDSLKSEPLEAMVTVDSVGITEIESWDRTKKTRREVFKPIKVNWDRVGAGGHFKMFDKGYTIQVIDDVDDVDKEVDNFRAQDSPKTKK